jgi:nucleoside 2-deoxyribosyltransferase
MAFKVFLSYGTGADEQVAAWRLQTLATSYGMHVSVPHRNGSGKAVTSQVRRGIDQSDCVLAIITSNIGPAVAEELNYALTRGKLIVPIVKQGLTLPPALRNLRVFQLSPWNTGEIEADVLKFLQEQKFGKEKQQAMGALVAIGLGLFLLAAFSKNQ